MMSATPEMWSKDIPKGKLAYPVLCDNMRFFSQRPTGAIRCELRTLQADANQIAFDVWLIGKDGPWACFKWVEALVNAGPLLAITPEERVRTLIGDEANPAIRLGEVLNNSWQVNTGAIIDPLPGTTAALLCSEAELNTRRDSPNKLEWDIRRIAAKECLQQHIFGEAGIRVHPRNIDLLELPKNRFIARHIVGLTAQQFIELAGPTKIHIAVNSTLETASALIKLGPCIPSA
jgi:hypothetical protein